jgi:hypothetical protein
MAALTGGLNVIVILRAGKWRGQSLLVLLVLAGLSAPSIVSAQPTLIELARVRSNYHYYHQVRYSVGGNLVGGAEADNQSPFAPVVVSSDITGGGCQSVVHMMTAFGGQPGAHVQTDGSRTSGATCSEFYSEAGVAAMYEAQIYGAHPALGNATIPVIVVGNGGGSGLGWFASVQISAPGVPTRTWQGAFEIGETVDLPANAKISVTVSAECSRNYFAWACEAHADPRFVFDQAEFDRRMGANTFPLARYFNFRYSEGMTGPSPRTAVPDFDRDLRSDVLWRHQTRGDVWLWPMNGAARTAETYVRTVADTNWEIRGLGDQTRDGNPDILWRHKTTGMVYFWPMNGSTRAAETYVATVDPAYDIVGTGDFNGDGKSDILWRHATLGEVWIWLMNGATPLGQVYVGTVDPAYVIQGVGDLDGDGKADIVWHHATLGEVWVWLMSGTTRLSATWVGTVPDVGYQIAGVADHDGDGKADILWRHATTGEVWVWRMDGAARLAEAWVGTVPDTNYRVVNTGDYDGDGKADILWYHATLGDVWVWQMDGTTKLSETWVGTVPDVGYQIVKVR